MKLFIFCVVSVVSLWALPPLPPLPALPSLSSLPSAPARASGAIALSAAQSAAAPAPAVAGAATDEQRLPPIMVDEKSSAVKNINLADADERAKKLDDIVKNISEIHQQVVEFQAVEQEIDGLFAGTSKKIDDFLVAVDGFVGQAGSYIQDLEVDFEKKKTELNAYLTPGCSDEIKKDVANALKIIDDAKAPVEELKKLLLSARDGRSAIGREEDVVRQKVVDFKKSSVDVAVFYARAVTAKNGLLVGGGDAAAVLSECTEGAKKAQDMVNSLKTKDGQEIRDTLKKLDGMVASGNDAQKTIEKKVSDLKKMVAGFSKLEDGLLLAQQADLIKKENIVLPKKDEADGKQAKPAALTESSPVQKEEKGYASDVDVSYKQEPVLGVRENIFQEVLVTVQRGTQLLLDKVTDGLGDVVVMVKQLITKQTAGAEEKGEELAGKMAAEKKLTVENKDSIAVAGKTMPTMSDSAKIDLPKEVGSQAAQSESEADVAPLLSSINKLADSIVTEHEIKKDVPAGLPALPPIPALPPVPKPI